MAASEVSIPIGGSISKGTKTPERLKQDYWLYVVYNCAANPEVLLIQDPVRLEWRPLVKLEHYSVSAAQLRAVGR
jgi:hypothetical protein